MCGIIGDTSKPRELDNRINRDSGAVEKPAS